MPLYPYKCIDGHTFDAKHRMDGSDAPISCPAPTGGTTPCGKPVVRQIAAPASHFPGAASWRDR